MGQYLYLPHSLQESVEDPGPHFGGTAISGQFWRHWELDRFEFERYRTDCNLLHLIIRKCNLYFPSDVLKALLSDFSVRLAPRRIPRPASLLLQLPRCTHRHHSVLRLEGQDRLQGPVVRPLAQHGFAYRHEGSGTESFTPGTEDIQESS